MPLVYAVLLVLLTYLSLRIRVSLIKARTQQLPEETTPSWMSEAIKGLVGTAGGIYLSVRLLFSFLQMPVPETVFLDSVQFDPIALISLLCAILQPLLKYVGVILIK